MDVLNEMELYGFLKTLLFLLENPQGIQKVELRTRLDLGSTASMRVHKQLFELGLITTVNHPDKHLFGLSEKGKQIAEKLNEIKILLEEPPNVMEVDPDDVEYKDVLINGRMETLAFFKKELERAKKGKK